MKKVCVLYYGWYEAPNGAAKFVKTLCKNKDFFLKNNICLHVFSLDAIKPKSFSDKTVIGKRNEKKPKLLGIIKKSTILMILYMWLIEERHHRRVVKDYLKYDFHDDIVHCQETTTAYYLLKHCKKKDFKLYISMHSNGEDYSMEFISRPCLNTRLGLWYLNRKYKYAIKYADKIGFVSRNSMETYRKNHPEIAEERLFYVYNGISDNHEQIDDNRQINKLNIVCVGGLSERKNQECLIDALAELTSNERGQIHLTLVGDGLVRSYLESKVLNYGLHNVTFAGSSDNVTQYLIQSDVFALVSKDEGLPIAIIEAMRAGLPIIGSRVAGIPEMIDDGVTGYIVEPQKDDVVKAFREVLRRKKDVSEMGRLSRAKFLQMFTLDAMLREYMLIYGQ